MVEWYPEREREREREIHKHTHTQRKDGNEERREGWGYF